MHNRTESRWLESNCSAVGEGMPLFSTIAKPALGMVPKQNFLAYSTLFIFLKIRRVPGNVVMVATDKCGKNLVEKGFFMNAFQVFCLFCYLLCERLFLGNCPWWLLHKFKYIFHFNRTWNECFLESTLRGQIFGEYLVLHQWLIKHQLCIGNLERFPSYTFINLQFL